MNRSHTRVSYNDVYSDNQFKDTDCRGSWDNAREQRMHRLSQIPQGATGKHTHFRAFDLAAIYTFLVGRPNSIDCFSEKDRNMIRQCTAGINGISNSKKRILIE